MAYAASTRAADFEPFARLVLRGAYEATLAVGHLRALQLGGGARAAVFLTSLGGGAFGNAHEWIRDAVQSALDKYRESPLDVTLVHYGRDVPEGWADMTGQTVAAAASADAASADGE